MTWSGRAIFTFLLLGGACWMLAETLTLGGPARLAPLWAIAPTCILLAILLALELWPRSFGRELPDPAVAPVRDDGGQRADASALLWFAGLVVLVLGAGVMAAIPVFFFLYATLQWRRPWWFALAVGVASFAVLYLVFSLLLEMYLPPGWLWPE